MLDHITANNRLNNIYDMIRKIRDQKGDDRCWKDYEELFKLLPEGYEEPIRDTSIELENCKWFLECAKNPKTVYISPQRRIETLENAIEKAVKDFWADEDKITVFENLEKTLRG